jgi:hypothetical protein
MEKGLQLRIAQRTIFKNWLMNVVYLLKEGRVCKAQMLAFKFIFIHCEATDKTQRSQLRLITFLG